MDNRENQALFWLIAWYLKKKSFEISTFDLSLDVVEIVKERRKQNEMVKSVGLGVK